MRTISISISHNNYTIIITIFNFKVSTNACPDCVDNCINFFIFKISSRRAFSVLITLPRNGNIAWICGLVQVLLNLPQNHLRLNTIHFSVFYFVQVLIYQIAKCLYACFSYLNEHLHELYVQLPLLVVL